MLYLLAFALGGFARNAKQFAGLAVLLLALDAGLLLLVGIPALQDGSSTVRRLLDDVPLQALIVPPIMGLGALCRRLVVGRRPPIRTGTRCEKPSIDTCPAIGGAATLTEAPNCHGVACQSR